MTGKVRENRIFCLHRSIWKYLEVFKTGNSVQGLRLRVGPLELRELVLFYSIRHVRRHLRV